MSTYSDLSGIFYIAEQHLADLSGLNPSTNPLPSMQALRLDLSNAYRRYSGATVSANRTLTHQKTIQSIIENETDRINKKKLSVDNALYGQKRMAQFSESYSKKYYAQIKILFIIIIVLLIYLGLTLLNNIVPIPEGLFTFIMILIGIFAFIVISFTIKDIYSRYNMDFDKLNLGPPSTTSIRGNIDINGNVLGNISGISCFEESCCPGNTDSRVIWNADLKQCVERSSFTLMSEASLLTPDLNVNGIVMPYEPSEINSYMKI